MNQELANTYAPLMRAIEDTLFQPACEQDVGVQLVELYLFLFLSITGIQSREELEDALLGAGVAADSRPSTIEALEIFASLRAEFMSGWEREPPLIH